MSVFNFNARNAEETVDEYGIPSSSTLCRTELETHKALASFWLKAIEEMKKIDLEQIKTPALPAARVKKIMKLDEDVHYISAETPYLLSKATELFIQELTIRAWIYTELFKRITLMKNDIGIAISKSDMFDFLIDIVPREEAKLSFLRNGIAKPLAITSDQTGIDNSTTSVTNSVPTSSSTGQILQNSPSNEGLQVVHQIVTPNGEVQYIPLTPEQSQMLRMQLQNNSNQPVIFQSAPVQVSANEGFQVAAQGTQIFIPLAGPQSYTN